MAHITIIGPQRREFLGLLRTLTTTVANRHVMPFTTIEDALNGEATMLDDADLVIVLQSYSDEHQQSMVDALIGRTIFGRLLCCYGPWCESDARTRSVWPDAVRVPVRLASALIEKELRECDSEEFSLPPTAARDEVFAHRLGTAAAGAPAPVLNTVNAAIIGPDRVFRRILARHLTDAGLRSLNIPLLRTRPQETVPAKETSRGPVHLVIHDLDPWCSVTEASLNAARVMFPAATVWGIATMPDAGLITEIADSGLECVVPKLDLELGLRWHLDQWMSAEKMQRVQQLKTP